MLGSDPPGRVVADADLDRPIQPEMRQMARRAFFGQVGSAKRSDFSFLNCTRAVLTKAAIGLGATVS